MLRLFLDLSDFDSRRAQLAAEVAERIKDLPDGGRVIIRGDDDDPNDPAACFFHLSRTADESGDAISNSMELDKAA